MVRKLLALGFVAFMIVGLVAPAASASKPDMFLDEWQHDWYIGACDGFDVRGPDDVEARIKFFYAQDGTVDRVHFKFTMQGIVYNTVDPGKALAGEAHYTALTDLDFEAWTTSGLFYRIKMPDGGVLATDAGRLAVDVSSGEPVVLWQHGNHQIHDGDLAAVCESLS